MDREEKIRAIVRSEIRNASKNEESKETDGLINHLASFSEHEAKKELEEKK